MTMSCIGHHEAGSKLQQPDTLSLEGPKNGLVGPGPARKLHMELSAVVGPEGSARQLPQWLQHDRKIWATKLSTQEGNMKAAVVPIAGYSLTASRWSDLYTPGRRDTVATVPNLDGPQVYKNVPQDGPKIAKRSAQFSSDRTLTETSDFLSRDRLAACRHLLDFPP